MTQSILALPDSDIAPVTTGAMYCSSKFKGQVTEMTFALHAMQRGWDVCTPSGDIKDYDHIIKRPGLRPIVVQVKRAYLAKRKTRDYYNIPCGQSSGTKIYSESAYDVLAAYLPDMDQWLFYKRSELGQRRKTTYTPNCERKKKVRNFAPDGRDPNNWELLDQVANVLTSPTVCLP